MRFPSHPCPNTNSYNLHIYSQIQSQTLEELINSFNLYLGLILEKPLNSPQGPDLTLQLHLLLHHYDKFYLKSLKTLKETPEKSDIILTNLKTILQYEYTIMKEVELTKGPEDLSIFVQFLSCIHEPNTISLLLRILAEKTRNAKFPDDSSKQSLYWQLKLSRFVQSLCEFFYEIDFDDLLNGSFSETYNKKFDENLKAALYKKVAKITVQQKSFSVLRDKLKDIAEGETNIREDVITKLWEAFDLGIGSKNDPSPDIYEVSGLLLLVTLVRNYLDRKDRSILNFLVIVENIRVSINSMKTPVSQSKLLGKSQNWKQFALKSIGVLNQKDSTNRVPLEYLSLLNDLASTQRFLLLKSQTNDQIYITCVLSAIINNANELSQTKSLCIRTTSLLDEALIEFVNVLRRNVFLSYDKYILEIAQLLREVLLELSLVTKIDILALKKVERLSFEILQADEQFIPALLNTTDNTSIVDKTLQSFAKLLTEGSNASVNVGDAANIVLKYFTELLTLLNREENQYFIEALKVNNFGPNILSLFQQASGKRIIQQNSDLNLRIILFALEYNKNSARLGLEPIRKEFNILNLDSLPWNNPSSSHSLTTTLSIKLISAAFEEDSIIFKNNKVVQEALLYFFQVSVLNNTSIMELSSAFRLSPDSVDHESNHRKIQSITAVLKIYQEKVQIVLQSVINKAEAQEKLAHLATELILGPLRMSHIMIEPLYQNSKEEVKQVLEECNEFIEIASDILMSPIMLFLPEQYNLPNKEAISISRRIPYLHSLSSIMSVNYFDKIAQSLASVALNWSSNNHICDTRKLLTLTRVVVHNESQTNEHISLIPILKQDQRLLSDEYTLLNVLYLLSNLKGYMFETKGDLITLPYLDEKMRAKAQQELEETLPSFIQFLNEFSKQVFSSLAEAPKGATTNSTNEGSQTLSEDSLGTNKHVTLTNWSAFLSSVWLGSLGFLALHNSNGLYSNGIILALDNITKLLSFKDLPQTVREQFIGIFCEIASTPLVFREGILTQKPRNNFSTLALFLQNAEYSFLDRRIQELDSVFTVNSFVKKIAEEDLHVPHTHIQSSVKLFYKSVRQNNVIRLDITRLTNDILELQNLLPDISLKDLRDFVSDVLRRIQEIIQSQLARSTSKVISSSSHWQIQKQKLVTLLKDIQSRSFKEDNGVAVDLLSRLSRLYSSISDQANELLDWNRTNEDDYPIEQDILSQVGLAFKTLAIHLSINGTEIMEPRSIQELGSLLERVLYDLRVSLSYQFLQGKKDTKPLQKALLSFISESVLDSIGQNSSIACLLDKEAVVRSFWIALYNLVLIQPNAMADIVDQGLLKKLLDQEYSSKINWGTSGLALYVFEGTMLTSLPLKDLIEINIKQQFIVESNAQIDLSKVLSSRFFTSMSSFIEDKDLKQVVAASIKLLRSDWDRNVYCETTPKLLSTFQAASSGSAKNELQEGPNLVESILGKLSLEARLVIDTLILAAINNYVRVLTEPSKEGPKRRRLTIELLQQLYYISVKHSHLVPYIYLKQLNTTILRELGLPSYFPYSKLLKEEKFTFLDFIVIVALKQDKSYVFPVLNFVASGGVSAHFDKDSDYYLDINRVLLGRVIKLADEIIDESWDSPTLDSVEMRRAILLLVKSYLTNFGTFSNLLVVKLMNPIIKKIANQILLSIEEPSQNNRDTFDIEIISYFLETQFKTHHGRNGSWSNNRMQYYYEIIKNYNLPKIKAEESSELLKSEQVINRLLVKQKPALNIDSSKKIDLSEGLSMKQETYSLPGWQDESKRVIQGDSENECFDYTLYYEQLDDQKCIRIGESAELPELCLTSFDFEVLSPSSDHNHAPSHLNFKDLGLQKHLKAPMLSFSGQNYEKITRYPTVKSKRSLFEIAVAIEAPVEESPTAEVIEVHEPEAKPVEYENVTVENTEQEEINIVKAEQEKDIMEKAEQEKIQTEEVKEGIDMKEELQQDDESSEAELFRKRVILFNTLVQPALRDMQAKGQILTQKSIKQCWLNHLARTRISVKNKLESVLLSLRISLIEKTDIDKVGIDDLDKILGPMGPLEYKYLIVALKRQAPRYIDDTINEKYAEVEPDLTSIDELINGDSGTFKEFLIKFNTNLGDEAKGSLEIQTNEQVEEDNHQEIGAKDTPPKFILDSEVVFCLDKVDFDEDPFSQLKAYNDNIGNNKNDNNLDQLNSDDNNKISPEILSVFQNYLPCSDEQIEQLIRILHIKTDALKSWGTQNETTLFYSALCNNPSNELKLVDAIIFLLLNPDIYNEETISKSPFLSKVTKAGLSIVRKSPQEIYKIFAENAFCLLNFVVNRSPLIISVSPDTMKSFAIKSTNDLKSEYRYEDKLSRAKNVFDLMYLCQKIPTVLDNEALKQVWIDTRQALLEFIIYYESPSFVLDLSSDHIEHILKQIGAEGFSNCFRNHPSILMNSNHLIIHELVISLKNQSKDVSQISAKLKEVEKESEPTIKEELLKPIENGQELREIAGTLIPIVSKFFNPLFESSCLFGKDRDLRNAPAAGNSTALKSMLKNLYEELQKEEVQMFILLIYEALDIYQRIIKSLDSLDLTTLARRVGIRSLIEIAISLYAITEMKNRLDEEANFVHEDFPKPKLSRITSKESNVEEPKKMERSFASLKEDRIFNFDQIFANFGLAYNAVLSNYFKIFVNNEYNQSVIHGLVVLLAQRFLFIINLDTKRKLIQKLHRELFFNENQMFYPFGHTVVVDRERLVDSFAEGIQKLTRSELAKSFNIQFKDEYGVDQGGLTREFFTLITSEIFDPENTLFKLSGNRFSIQPAPDSIVVPNALKLFELAGIIVAKAIIAENPIDCFFTKSFLKHCLGKKITIDDLDELDPNLLNNIKWLLDNDVSEFGLIFEYETEILGRSVTRSLVEGGSNIEVNENNKNEYVLRLCEALMMKEIEGQISAFLQGLYAIIPRSFLSMLLPSDLEVIIAGTRTIDLEDMRSHCRYEFLSDDSDLVKWFWEILSEFDQEQLESFLFFISGSTKSPAGGFIKKPITLRLCSHFVKEHFPIAHTCSYTLDVPEYQAKDAFKQRLMLAIFDGKGPFFII